MTYYHHRNAKKHRRVALVYTILVISTLIGLVFFGNRLGEIAQQLVSTAL